jgi:uncharacterized RDD family membrane protein YckC
MKSPRIVCLAGAMIACLAAASTVRADDWRASRALTVGSDGGAWVIGVSDPSGTNLPVIHFWYSGQSAQKPVEFRQSELLPPIGGDPLFVAADLAALHILYANLTSGDVFPNKRATIGAKWVGRSGHPPLAWAGDAAVAVSYALARSSSLEPATSGKKPGGPKASSDAEATAGNRLVLLTLRSGTWRRSDGPAGAEAGTSFWLCARNETVWLFWKEGLRIRCSSTSMGKWSETQDVLSADDFRCAFTGANEGGAAFIAGRGNTNEAVRLYLYLTSPTENNWTESGFIREGNEALTIDPARCGVSLGRGQLIVARATSTGAMEVGTGAVQRDPSVRFSTPPTRQEAPAMEATWEQMLRLAALLSLLTVVLWHRRQQATTQINLPPGIRLAAVWRRGLATILDLAPAIMATAPWWLPKANAMLLETSYQPTQADVEALAQRTIAENYASLLIYGLWCLIWERALGATPGKLLFGCRVIGIDGGRPSLAALVARNIDRVVMMWLGAEGLLAALMTILVVTRNRQRIGDLIGGTIVVEQDVGPALSETRGPDDDPLL